MTCHRTGTRPFPTFAISRVSLAHSCSVLAQTSFGPLPGTLHAVSSARSRLQALSPLDGRYATDVAVFAAAFSEEALIRQRVRVEVEWFITLSDLEGIDALAPLGEELRASIRRIASEFSAEDAMAVKEIESETNHDVKAVEYFLKDRLQALGVSEPEREMVHFACTSEDINNISHALMLREGMEQAWLPLADRIAGRLEAMARDYAALPMLSRTHGQPATPTTLGKELAVFALRLRRQEHAARSIPLSAKLNGAVGTYGAHLVAYPDIDWEGVSRAFVESFGLEWNPLTTQIEPHDRMAELFDAVVRHNTVLLDLCRDLWSYISLSYIRQRKVEGEVGSSTMPHKVNPIHFENAEANLQISSALLEHLGTKLMVSRLQRDLSDSSAIRNVGSALGYSGLAMASILKGMGRIDADPAQMERDLEGEWGVLAEAIQTVMRRYGLARPYERLKELTRGNAITPADLAAFVERLEIPAEAKMRLAKLTPATYLGLAERLARTTPGPTDTAN